MSYYRYSNDPRVLTARFASQCAKCHAPIRKGDEIYYYPSSKTVYGMTCGCGGDAQRDFESAAIDEDFLS